MNEYVNSISFNILGKKHSSNISIVLNCPNKYYWCNTADEPTVFLCITLYEAPNQIF